MSKRNSYRPGGYSPLSFSSMSMGTYSIPRISTGNNQGSTITAVTINQSLLTPFNIDIDPNVQVVRTQEKEQIKSLNNRFAEFIDKVRHLEQENKRLETKWKMLEGKTEASSNIEPMLKDYIGILQRQLDFLGNDKVRLEMENEAMHKHVDEYKTKYEDEIRKRNDVETEFVNIKKDVDAGYLFKVELDDNVDQLREELNFLMALNEAEIRELQENMKEMSVVVQMDNSRSLNMNQIVDDVKKQYEDVAARSRQDAENWYKGKFDKMAAEADQYGNEVQTSKAEIAELTRVINRLKTEIEAAKTKCQGLESQISEKEADGDLAVKEAHSRIQDLEVALQRAKQDMARQIREYQELMNVKLALDIEIGTYMQLLEGEEKRLGKETVANIQTLVSRSNPRKSFKRQLSGPIVIKTVETNNVTYNN